MRRILTIAAVVTVIGVSACGPNYGMTGYSTPTSSPATGGGVPTLTVMNFLRWCSVTINGGAASTGETVAASVTPGSVATVVATPASSSFQIGADPRFGVDEERRRRCFRHRRRHRHERDVESQRDRRRKRNDLRLLPGAGQQPHALPDDEPLPLGLN